MNPGIVRCINHVAAAAARPLARLLLHKEWNALAEQLAAICATSNSRALGALPAALIAAEDRRYYEHRGFDVAGIARAFIRLVQQRYPIEGGSTITQQLVRTITRDYDVSLWRKVREVLLSSLLDSRFSKEQQISAYLEIAYFGWRMNGVTDAQRRLGGRSLSDVDFACELIARLKYPQPRRMTAFRLWLIQTRSDYILEHLGGGPRNVDAHQQVRLNRT